MKRKRSSIGLLKKLFYADSQRIVVNSAKKEESMQLLKKASQKVCITPHATNLEMLHFQWKLMDKKIFYMQWTLLAALLVIYHGLFAGRLSQGLSQKHDFMFFAVLSSAAFSMLSVLFYTKDSAYGMEELTESCFFNNRQGIIYRMTLAGACTLAYFGSFFHLLRKETDYGAVSVILYLSVPFFVTGCVQSAVLLLGFGRQKWYGVTATGIAMGIFWSVMSGFPSIYDISMIRAWAAALVLSLLLYTMEIRYLLRGAGKQNLRFRTQ